MPPRRALIIALRIRMGEAQQPVGMAHPDAEFFLEFALQRVESGLARLQLAAGELCGCRGSNRLQKAKPA